MFENKVKIGAILPLRPDPRKQRVADVIRECKERYDCTFVLHDRMRTTLPCSVTEELVVSGGNGIWNDYCSRLALMARAIKYGCSHVAQIDDDESHGPSLTRKRIKDICQELIETGSAEAIVKVRTAWNETHWRTDGIFGKQVKSFILMNPFSVNPIRFEWPPDKRLHHFPNLAGPKIYVNDWITHFGLMTPEMREVNAAKYKSADKHQEFSSVPYDYVLDESGITLEKL